MYGISRGQYAFSIGKKIIFGVHFYCDRSIFLVLQGVTLKSNDLYKEWIISNFMVIFCKGEVANSSPS